ncbi:hypothetical protein [Methanobrevibacter sp.]|uniref:hypothetical protein n=1 Tax=Methanobrevibacter sp. TaxID=66852 RepID=UPI00388F9339
MTVVEKTIENGEDILHAELIEVLGLLTAETIAAGKDVGEMYIQEINSNKGSFKYTIRVERIIEKRSLRERIKGWIL